MTMVTRTIALAAFLLGAISQAMAQGAFYEATAAEIENGPPGSVIRDEPMGASPPGGRAHRVLYRSTSPEGKPIAVSGVVIIPPGLPPAGGWPIVAWAHPTTGIVPRCAPSLATFIYQQIAGIDSSVLSFDMKGAATAGDTNNDHVVDKLSTGTWTGTLSYAGSTPAPLSTATFVGTRQ